MKKYKTICRAVWKENLQYAPQIFMGFISYFIFIIIFVQLWNTIYEEPGGQIFGYTKEQMLWYVIITEMIWFSAGSQTVTRQVSADIRGGNIAYMMNKPYHYTLYILAKYTGEWSIRLPVYACFAAVMGMAMAGRLPGFQILTLLAAVPCMVLGIFIHAVYKISISLFSFWIEDAGPFQWVYDKLLLVLGTLFPVEIFSQGLQPLLKLTPVYTVCYGPAKMIVDFSMEKYTEILMAQSIYLAAGFGLMFLLYTKGEKKLYVNGG